MTMQASPIILGQHLGRDVDEAGTSDLHRIVGKAAAILSRRRWLFVLPTLTAMLVSLAVGLSLKREYFVTARFERRNDDVITTLVNKNTPYSFASLGDTLVVDLKGYRTVEAAVDQLGITHDYPRDAAGNLTPEGEARRRGLVDRLTRDITISLEEKSNFLDVIDLEYMGQEPEIAAKVMNQLVDRYKMVSRSKATEILNSSYEFFTREAEKQRKRMTGLEDELLRITLEYPEANPASPGLIDQRILSEQEALEDLERDRHKLETNITAREEYLRELETQRNRPGAPASQPALTPLNMVPNPRRLQLVSQMEEIRAQIADAKAIRQVTDYHPDIVTLRRKLESLASALERQPEYVTRAALTMPAAGASPEADPWLAERQRVQMELKSYRETLEETQQRAKKHEAEKARLVEARDSLFERRQAYTLCQQELERAKADLVAWKGPAEQINRILTAEAENRGIQFAAHREAHYPGVLCAPSLGGVYLLSLGVALGVGIAAVFLREVLDRSVRDPARVRETLGIPVLETIGEFKLGRPGNWFIRHRLFPAIASVQIVFILGFGALVYLRLKEVVFYDRLVERLGQLWMG